MRALFLMPAILAATSALAGQSGQATLFGPDGGYRGRLVETPDGAAGDAVWSWQRLRGPLSTRAWRHDMDAVRAGRRLRGRGAAGCGCSFHIAATADRARRLSPYAARARRPRGAALPFNAGRRRGAAPTPPA